MSDSSFRFKHFCCQHSKSSMKIGVDSVLLAAWADTGGNKILDVGTGCGVISLMCAQRNKDAQIIGIDIDEESVCEAAFNFKNSPWCDRLEAKRIDFNLIEEKYDLIISNPPYFNSGINNPDTCRLKARHQSTLSPELLIRKGFEILNNNGRLAMIVPYNQIENLINTNYYQNFKLKRLGLVKGNHNSKIKRALLEFEKTSKSISLIDELIILEETRGEPTERYKNLCKDFYIKF